jgi:hypothetical protein
MTAALLAEQCQCVVCDYVGFDDVSYVACTVRPSTDAKQQLA